MNDAQVPNLDVTRTDNVAYHLGRTRYILQCHLYELTDQRLRTDIGGPWADTAAADIRGHLQDAARSIRAACALHYEAVRQGEKAASDDGE